jgi:hypothetical protein
MLAHGMTLHSGVEIGLGWLACLVVGAALCVGIVAVLVWCVATSE